jgi:uncharacterized OB-fold protein
MMGETMSAAAQTAPSGNDVQPIGPQVFEMGKDGPYLIGGRRKSDGRIVFPMPQGAESKMFDPVTLADKGTLWSFTVQRFRPKTPSYMGADDEKTFKPFALGYVELPGQVIVETRIEVDNVQRLKVGLPMKLVIVPFPRLDGKTTSSYAFAPA